MRRAHATGKALLAAAMLAIAAPTLAIDTSSSHFRNSRSSIDSSGQPMVASSFFSNESSLGEVAQTTHTSNSYQTRSGLMPIYEYPGTVPNLYASTGPSVGQIYLQWTSPGNDAYAANTAARNYIIKFSTDPAQSPALSDAFFNAAAFVGAPPIPKVAGQTQTMIVSNLTPGVTYYFAFKAAEADGLLGPLSQGVTAQATTGITAITNLTASSGPYVAQISLKWTAPSYSGSSLPLAYQIRVSTTGNLFNNSDFLAAQPLSAFSTATIPSVGFAGSYDSMTVTGLVPCQMYFFAIRAVDSGTPQLVGQWLRDANLNLNVFNYATAGCPTVRAPMEPLNVSISTTATTATISWSPVTMLADGTPFAYSTAPAQWELTGYHVLRATSPIEAPWTDMTGLTSTGTWSWTDTASGPQYYYMATAQNNQATSLGSMIRSAATKNIWVVGYDGMTTMEIPDSYANGLTNYYVNTSSHPEDIGGPVLKSIEFVGWKNGVALDPLLKLNGMSNLVLHYAVDAKGGVTVSGLGAQTQPTSPTNMSTFWFNGTRYVQVYGQVDTASQTMYVQTPYLGRYQLRSAERVGGFSFNDAGVSNRFITPNGDGKNDNIMFTFDNPQFSSVTGRVFDIRGHFVANLSNPSICPAGPGQCLMWDGKSSNGSVVTGGVYIYQLDGEGKSFNGTVVVVR